MNYLLLIITILFFGIIGGCVNAIRTKNQYWKSIIKGISASFLIPIFLELIKSEIGKNLGQNIYDYLVFGGLCLIAAIFSDKFIDTIGESILKKAENAEKKAEESNDKVNIIIEKNANPEENEDIESKILKFNEFTKSNNKEYVEKIIKSFKSNEYKFRTMASLASDINENIATTSRILMTMQKYQLVEKINIGKRTLWTLKE